MKLSQSSGDTLRHKIPPLGSLEYKPNQLGVQAKRLKAQATALKMPWTSRRSF
jgi:hypothetical protein